MSLYLLVPLLIFTIFIIKWLKGGKENTPPSPPKLPIIGNLHQLGFLPHRSLKSLAEKYGSIMLLHLGSKPTLIISSPTIAETVLKTHDLNFSSRPQANFIGRLGYNFKSPAFAPYGEYWRQIRSICVLQLLSNKRVHSFRSVREEEIALMLENITRSCMSRSPINISEMLVTLNNDIISRVAIGKKYSGEKSGSNFKKIFDEYLELLGVFNVADYIPWLGWINHINGLEPKVKRVAKELDAYLETIVEEGILKKNNIDDQENDQHTRKQNFLDVLLEIQEKNTIGFDLHRDSLKAIILDMFLGGTDTTSTLLEWAISELIKNKNVRIKLQDEVRRFSYDHHDGKLNLIREEDLEKLPYLKAVLKETFRMHPPLPLLVPRESRNNVNVLGYDISAGTQVFINVFAIGRDSSLWENADEFWPERFLNRSVDVKGQHFELIPFGYGRRSCPGSGFAMVTAEVALANLMLKFDFALPDGAKDEDLDMTEVPSIVTRRKMPLVLDASLPNK